MEILLEHQYGYESYGHYQYASDHYVVDYQHQPQENSLNHDGAERVAGFTKIFYPFGAQIIHQ